MVKKKTHEEFAEEVISKFGDIYIFHDKYSGQKNKILVEHKDCGYKWNVFPKNLSRGQSKCPQCTGKKHMSSSEFCDYVKKETNGEFSSLGDFKGIKYTTTFKHNKCGYTFEALPFHVRKGELGCRNCSNMLIHDKERVELLLEDKYGTEYTLLSDEVKNNRDQITIRHNACGKDFETTSNRIINLSIGCSHCNVHGSKGELEIEKILKENKIKHKREYTFDDCRHKSLLFFDFAIFDSSDNLLVLIEFDGKQHFEPIDFFGGIEGFEEGKIRDNIKNEYCKNNNIPLIRIPYFKEKELDKIINGILFDHKLKDGDLVLC